MAPLKPEGRLHQHGKLTLLRNGEPLYIPVTQEPAPMTEDLLEEQSEVLAKLGHLPRGRTSEHACRVPVSSLIWSLLRQLIQAAVWKIL